MNVAVLMRLNKLLKDMSESLVTYIPEPRYIYFYGDESTEALCSMVFDSLESTNSGGNGNTATYIFGIGGSNIMRGIVAKSGEVKKFKITGKVNISDTDPDTDFITGTVGSMSSSADIKFNKVNWVVGKNITITNLTLVMR